MVQMFWQKPLVKLCNISISSGLLPSDCKIAKLKPVYEQGSKTNPQNVRPISLLLLISKNSMVIDIKGYWKNSMQ